MFVGLVALLAFLVRTGSRHVVFSALLLLASATCGVWSAVALSDIIRYDQVMRRPYLFHTGNVGKRDPLFPPFNLAFVVNKSARCGSFYPISDFIMVPSSSFTTGRFFPFLFPAGTLFLCLF